MQAELSALLAQATMVLRERFPSLLGISEPQVLKDWERNIILRCRLKSGREGPPSVIVKQIKTQPSCGFSDWAALEFLADCGGTEDLAPRFYGGRVDPAFFLMEDLGRGGSIDDLLQGSHRREAEEALFDLARITALLHARTREHEDKYHARRAALPAGDGLGREVEVARWREGLAIVRQWFEGAGCTLPPAATACFEDIAAAYADPGPFLTFTHGDMAPTNNHVAGGRLRLLDFEYGAFRHALYDLSAWNILCPLPDALVMAMQRAYRAELAPAWEAMRDEATYRDGWARMCAWRALALLSWIPVPTLETDGLWVGNWTRRSAALRTLERLQAAAGVSQGLEPLADAAGTLARALGRRWPSSAPAGPVWSALARQ